MQKYHSLVLILFITLTPVAGNCKLPIPKLELEIIFALTIYKLSIPEQEHNSIGSSFPVENEDAPAFDYLSDPLSAEESKESSCHEQSTSEFSNEFNQQLSVHAFHTTTQSFPLNIPQLPFSSLPMEEENSPSSVISIEGLDENPTSLFAEAIPYITSFFSTSYMAATSPPTTSYEDINPNVTFAIENVNDEIFAKILTYIKQLNQQSAQPNHNLQTFLEEVETFLQSLQCDQIPKTYPLNNLDKIKSLINQPEFKTSMMDLATNFLSLVATDYCMYAMITQQSASILAEYIRQLPNLSVEEPEAGAGWYHMALSQQGINIDSSDNYNICTQTSFSEVQRHSFIKERLRSFYTRSQVFLKDAYIAVAETKHQIVLLCFPEYWSDSFISLLDVCAERGLLIIHISYEEESFSSLPELNNMKNEFIPVDDIPDLQIHGQALEIGFWRNIPDWYHRFMEEQGKPPLKKKD